MTEATHSTPSTAWLPALEDAMKKPVREAFENDGFLVREEVSIFGRTPDVIAFDPTTQRLIVVELKLEHWQRALRQCSGPRLWSDEVYVAMPSATIHRAFKQRERFEHAGVGLMGVGPNAVEIWIAPNPQTPAMLATRKSALAAFMEVTP